MSESVIEIDATIDDDTEVKETIVGTESPCLVESSNNKRRLDEDVEHVDGDDDDEETAVRSSRKKFCTENDTRTESEKDNVEVNETETAEIEESVPAEKAIDEPTEEAEDYLEEIPSSQDSNILNKSSEVELVEEYEEEYQVENTLVQQEYEGEEEEEMMDEEHEEGEDEEEDEMEEEYESDSDADDDGMMMSRVMQNTRMPQMTIRPTFHTENDEPIELDDSDEDEVPAQSTAYQEIKTETEEVEEEEEEFPTDNNVLEESEEESEEVEEEDMLTELRRNHLNRRKTYPVELMGRLIKRGLKKLTTERFRFIQPNTSTLKKNAQEQNELKQSEIGEKDEIPDSKDDKIETNNDDVKNNGEVHEAHEEPMDVSQEAAQDEKIESGEQGQANVTINDKPSEPITSNSSSSNDGPETASNTEKGTVKPVKTTKTTEAACDKEADEINGKSADDKSPDELATEEALSLLKEIEKSSIDDIFKRHVMKGSERSASLDEFAEELFNCLQLNKISIDKATLEWNAKLHMKFKIRQLMERVRRHRAVMEIESFGYKPELSGNNVHPIISSKSSTTTNSEGENFEKNLRMSNESVNRLIQDVRATIIKRDEQQRHRIDDSILSENAYDNNSWSSLQMGPTQGRQGQIVDVQSIINDFRQRNPQEIPRRGRRVKSLNHNSYFDGTNSNHDEMQNQSMKNEFANFISQEFSTRSGRSSSQFPEVSLHPVHQNLYKSHLNIPGEINYAGQQKSSLLQSILTKSTKSPVGFQSSTPTTSTLARLLTAPERSLQSTPKQSFSSSNSRQSSSKVHNGEITITPINCNRSKDFSMDDDENSMEPPLVIDENFDGRSFEDKKSAELLCQGCKKNKAFFMCAGCSRQWYCSKECQEMAWDSHSSYCSI